jgi:hypothetical protein
MTFEDYFDSMKKNADAEKAQIAAGLPIDSSHKAGLNFQRMQRILKTYTVDSGLNQLLTKITSPQLWMVLTEEWCGDSAQTLPFLAKISKANPLIDFRILLRDKNLNIMDLYLSSEQTRSIPKLVAFDLDGNELFRWGARPAEADNLVKKLKAEGKTKDEFIEQLHLWYAKNKGKALEDEMKELISKAILPK